MPSSDGGGKARESATCARCGGERWVGGELERRHPCPACNSPCSVSLSPDDWKWLEQNTKWTYTEPAMRILNAIKAVTKDG